MFYDFDQNFQIETHYQNCMAGIDKFGSTCNLIGDVNKQKNGFLYDVKGKNGKTSLANTTWTQQNVTHSDRKIRKIYRFALADAPPFPPEQIPTKYEAIVSIGLKQPQKQNNLEVKELDSQLEKIPVSEPLPP